jgi:hypothetical protein
VVSQLMLQSCSTFLSSCIRLFMYTSKKLGVKHP